MARKLLRMFVASEEAWLRVVVEKPFGTNLASATALAEEMFSSLAESEILLVDHYMGKAGVKAIREFRDRNRHYEHWLRVERLRHVEIAMLETEDTAGRTAFYDEVGVVRDTMQNHLMMMMALLTMELGPKFADRSEAVNEAGRRLELLKLVKTVSLKDVESLGQYDEYNAHVIADHAARGDTAPVAPSRQATFARVKLEIDSDRWRGIPFYFTSGKCLASRMAFAFLVFESGQRLVINVQGKFNDPEADGAAIVGTLDVPPFMKLSKWTQHTIHNISAPKTPNAYEILLDGALDDRPATFVRLSEVLESWRVWTPILESIDKGEVSLVHYPRGGAGLPMWSTGPSPPKSEL